MGGPGPSASPLSPDQEPGGAVTHPPGSEAASGQKPSLRDRLRALEDKHGQGARPPILCPHGEPVDSADPCRLCEQDVPTSLDQAGAVVESVFGDAITWSREFYTHTTEDGRTEYVDKRTGQVYDTLPTMHDKDGQDT